MKIKVIPCLYGSMVYGENKMALATVEKNGGKKVISSETKNKIIFHDIPFIRGIEYFFCGIFALFCGLNYTSNLTKNDKRNLVDKASDNLGIPKFPIIMTLVGAISIILSALLLGLFPAKIGYLIVGKKGNFFVRNLLIAILKIFCFFLLLGSIKLIPQMQQFYRFNAGSNYIILNRNNIKRNKKGSYHYSLNILNFIVFAFILDFFMVTLIAVSISIFWNFVINLLIYFLSISLAYEILYFVSKNKFAQKFVVITSFFVTSKPTTTHEEISYVALTELELMMTQKGRKLMEENDKNKIPFSSLYAEVKTKLAKAGKVDISDVDWIIATILNKNRTEIKLLQTVSEKDYNEIIKATNRRINGEPLSNIFGFVDFYGLRFDVNKNVLSPRMETELLVERVINLADEFKKPVILDLCTGSGAIAISVAKNINAKVFGSDYSKPALLVAERNAKKNNVNVEFLYSNLFENLKKRKKFDIIVSNPPYIKSKDIKKLDIEVRDYDPIMALDGGEDGFDFYREIVLKSKNFLNNKGYLIFEIGKGQGQELKKIMKENGFVEVVGFKDYNKIERIICGKYNK